MPRPPKHPSVRQRSNRASTAAVLRPLTEDEIELPELPARYDNEGKEIRWSADAQRYWLRIWSSPMAPEFHHQSDIEGLYRLVALVDAFWKRPNATLNGEIRLYEQQFGLNPLARRRLDWTIASSESAVEAAAERKSRKASRPAAYDDDDTALSA